MSKFELSHVIAQVVVNERDSEGNIVNRHALPQAELYHPHGAQVLELIRRQLAELQKPKEEKSDDTSGS